ncbi:hypothetical protein ACFVRR_15130 [Gottfriedia sp. NPDC057948]|uniref:hypothetical protein n=1 Tax=Gottfriedia sp. NPDC057948 TaxID=3346287 RepID=UPI0036D7D2AD
MSIILEQKLQFIPPIYVADVDEYDRSIFIGSRKNEDDEELMTLDLKIEEITGVRIDDPI